ncbi:ribonuclease HII [Bradyrhizobium liaoningense]
MIRDKSAKSPAKDAPKKEAAKKAAPAKAAKLPADKAPAAKASAVEASAVKASAGKAPKVPAGKKGIIAIAPPSFRRERALIKRGVWPVAGCDEAGRGPLAGPVVAAAVILDPDRIPRGIDDSKRLTAEEREKLFDKICATAQVSVAVASPSRIDRDNILRASLWALKRAVVALPEAPRHVFVDGRDRLDTECDCEAVIGGDGIVLSIAAASIVAKVTRDRLMCALAQDCPGYGFEQHKGYAVPEHLAALDRLGPSVHHRRFFAPVAAARAKHMPWTVEPVLDLFAVTEVEVQVDAAVEIDVSANL